MSGTMRELTVEETEAVSGGAPMGRGLYICYDRPTPQCGTPEAPGGGYDVPTDKPYDPVDLSPITRGPTDVPWGSPVLGRPNPLFQLP